MTMLGLSDQEQTEIFSVIAAILHLGNTRFVNKVLVVPPSLFPVPSAHRLTSPWRQTEEAKPGGTIRKVLPCVDNPDSTSCCPSDLQRSPLKA